MRIVHAEAHSKQILAQYPRPSTSARRRSCAERPSPPRARPPGIARAARAPPPAAELPRPGRRAPPDPSVTSLSGQIHPCSVLGFPPWSPYRSAPNTCPRNTTSSCQGHCLQATKHHGVHGGNGGLQSRLPAASPTWASASWRCTLRMSARCAARSVSSAASAASARRCCRAHSCRTCARMHASPLSKPHVRPPQPSCAHHHLLCSTCAHHVRIGLCATYVANKHCCWSVRKGGHVSAHQLQVLGHPLRLRMRVRRAPRTSACQSLLQCCICCAQPLHLHSQLSSICSDGAAARWVHLESTRPPPMALPASASWSGRGSCEVGAPRADTLDA